MASSIPAHRHQQPVFKARTAQTLSASPKALTISPSVIRFGITAPASVPAANRIDDDVYQLLLDAPKTELHVHQSGSSSISFLKYALRQAIKRGDFSSLPLYNADGTWEDVPLKDRQGKLLQGEDLRRAMEKVLRWENLREYFRFQMQVDNRKDYMPSGLLTETVSEGVESHPPITPPGGFDFGKLRSEGLSAYRNTSMKINPYVKNDDAAYILAYEYARDMALENVRYTEYRVSPLGNNIGGKTYQGGIEDVFSAVHQGFEDARETLGRRDYRLDYGLIVLFERQGKPDDTSPAQKVERAVQLAREVIRLKQEGKYNIAGVDLAGDEANNPVSDFEPAFKLIREYNESLPEDRQDERIGITIHAGETAHSADQAKGTRLSGWESIAEAIRIAHSPKTPLRIGHGLQIVNSSDMLREAFNEFIGNPYGWQWKYPVEEILESSPLLREVIEKGIVLEMCPKSNLQTYGINPDTYAIRPDRNKGIQALGRLPQTEDKYTAEAYAMHPAVFLSRLGVKITISTDNRTISNSDTPNEFVKLYKYGGLTYDDFKRMVLDGFDAAFISDEKKKAELRQEVEGRFKKLESRSQWIQGMQKMGQRLSLGQRVTLVWKALLENVKDFLNVLRVAIEFNLPETPKEAPSSQAGGLIV